MTKTAGSFLSGLLLAMVPSLFGVEPLPRHMTDAERLVWDDYINTYPVTRGATPPEAMPYTPAEWHEAQGIIIVWADYYETLREIVRHAVQEVTVYIICRNPATVRDFLAADGVSLDRIVTIEAPFDSVWVRDYGPQSIYLQDSHQLAFVDWVYNRPRRFDDAIPAVMAENLNLPLFQMTQRPYRLIAAGGNFMTDGRRKGFSSELISAENRTLSEAQIDTIKMNYMGIDRYTKMPTLPHDPIDHLDLYIKLLDEETLLVGQFPEGVSDGPQIEANLEYILNNFQTPHGRPYRVIRIPMPADENGDYPPDSHYLTYTNSMILNGSVFVPLYGLAQDEEALDVYRNAMPGYKLVGINMRNLISANGAMHCVTREIAAANPIFIHHSPIRDRVDYSSDGFAVTAGISSASGIDRATLYWKTENDEAFTAVAMENDQDMFMAVIPNQIMGTLVNYYIKATDGTGKVVGRPWVAPAGSYAFEVGSNGLGFDFKADMTKSAVNEAIEFTSIDEGIEAQSYVWDFGDGAVPATADTGGPHSVVYALAGEKTITLTINDCSALAKSNYIGIVSRSPQDGISILFDGVRDASRNSLTDILTQAAAAVGAARYTIMNWNQAVTIDMLAEADVFFVYDVQEPYTPAEIAAVHSFLDNGGRLLVFSHGINAGGNGQSLEQMLAPYGIGISQATVAGDLEITLPPHPILEGLDAPLGTGDGFAPLTGGGVPLAANGDAVGAVAATLAGGGRMVVVSAAMMLNNGVFGTNEENFLLNSLDWLATPWRFNLEIANGYPATLTLAQRADAAHGMDDYDVPASAAPADEAAAWLETTAGTMLHKDYRPPDFSTAWMLQVDARNVQADCVLAWNPSMLPPEGLYAYDVDADGHGIPGGDGFFMDETATLIVEAGTWRRFRLVSGLNTFDMHLKPGWNLISVPLLPVDNDTAVVLRNQHLGSVWDWQQGWFVAAATMRPLRGYWVYYGGAEPIRLTIAGLPVEDAWGEFPAGWNLVGPGGLPSDGILETPLATVPDHAGSGQAWRCYTASFQPATELKSGIGYWIYLHIHANVLLAP